MFLQKIAVAFSVLSQIILLVLYPQLPDEQIPTHFGLLFVPDAFGTGWSAVVFGFGIIGFAAGLYLLISGKNFATLCCITQ